MCVSVCVHVCVCVCACVCVCVCLRACATNMGKLAPAIHALRLHLAGKHEKVGLMKEIELTLP